MAVARLSKRAIDSFKPGPRPYINYDEDLTGFGRRASGRKTWIVEYRPGAFTGCRRSEILNLKWSEVDFERGMLNLTDSKTGRKSVILNAPALAILSELSRLGSYVIVARIRMRLGRT